MTEPRDALQSPTSVTYDPPRTFWRALPYGDEPVAVPNVVRSTAASLWVADGRNRVSRIGRLEHFETYAEAMAEMIRRQERVVAHDRYRLERAEKHLTLLLAKSAGVPEVARLLALPEPEEELAPAELGEEEDDE